MPPALRLGWEHPLPGWAWALVVVGAMALAAWSYLRLAGSTRLRMMLAAARALVLLLLAVLLCGPRVVFPREHVEPDWVVILADRSSSMTIADGPVQNGSRSSRDAELSAALDATAEMWRSIGETKRIVWLGFHSGTFDLATTADGLPELGEASGARTRLGAALDQAMQRAAARPISAIIVMSDGRSGDPPSRALIRKLQAEAAPVHVVPLGSSEPLGDLAVGRAVAPDRAFVRDEVPVTIELERFGDAAEGMNAVARLIDERSGVELDRVEVQAGGRAEVTLTGRAEEPGEALWRVEVDLPSPDLVAENNARTMRIEFVDRPIRVLFVEGYPRWEYRFVKDLLVREDSIESSIMLFSADRDFAQEGDVPITRLPQTMEEFTEYDLVIIGDVPAGYFTPAQLDLLRDAIAERGMGLLWIAGPRSMPSTWAGTALADLLPMRPPFDLAAIGQPVTMEPTPLATRLGVLQLQSGGTSGWPAELADPSYGWSALQYAQRIEPESLKPAVEVLATTAQSPSGAALPLVVAMRYGAGQTVYVATDEIWRWRYGRGETLPEQFWIQMVRMLGRERLAGGEPALLEVEPRRAVADLPVRISLRLLDASVASAPRATVRAAIETVDGRRLAEIELQATDGTGGEFAATWLPEGELGEDGAVLVVRIDDPTASEPAVARLRTELTVERPDDERRQPETDHAALASLAAETGGSVIAVDDLGELKLRNREVRTEDPIIEPVWNTPLAFCLVLVLLTAEWIGRKSARLA